MVLYDFMSMMLCLVDLKLQVCTNSHCLWVHNSYSECYHYFLNKERSYHKTEIQNSNNPHCSLL